MPNKPAIRYRFTVPAEDTSVQDWLNAQIHLSMSLRLLIKEDIIRNGCTDVTCRSVEQSGKRGRPTNAEMERRRQHAASDDIPQAKAASVPADAGPVVGEAAKPPGIDASRQEAVPEAAPGRSAGTVPSEPVEVAQVRPKPDDNADYVPAAPRPPKVAERRQERPTDAKPVRDRAREDSITAMFAGGGSGKGLSAAAMGLLDDDGEDG